MAGRGFGREDDVVISVIDMQDAFEMIVPCKCVAIPIGVRVFFNLGINAPKSDKVICDFCILISIGLLV